MTGSVNCDIVSKGRGDSYGVKCITVLEIGNWRPARRVEVRKIISKVKNHNPKFAIRNYLPMLHAPCSMPFNLALGPGSLRRNKETYGKQHRRHNDYYDIPAHIGYQAVHIFCEPGDTSDSRNGNDN
jgi:hypothetical protein